VVPSSNPGGTLQALRSWKARNTSTPTTPWPPGIATPRRPRWSITSELEPGRRYFT
jgi:hypothetical protein